MPRQAVAKLIVGGDESNASASFLRSRERQAKGAKGHERSTLFLIPPYYGGMAHRKRSERCDDGIGSERVFACATSRPFAQHGINSQFATGRLSRN
jgi:hypothetical protein